MSNRSSCFKLPHVAFFLCSVVVLTGCMVGPNYQKPETEMPTQWSEAQPVVSPAVEAEPVDIARWWTVFKDSTLESLIDRAVLTNKDLKLAEARIREARGLRKIAGADLYPNVNSSAAYSRSRRSENATSGIAIPSSASDLFQAGFDALWEIDIFGGTRRAVEAASADLEASIESRRDVLLTLLSEVARNYIQVRGDQLRIAIALKNIDAQTQSLDLTQARFDAGLSSQLDVVRAEGQLAATQATIPALERSARQAIHQLSVLLGQEPGALLNELLEAAPLPVGPPEVPLGIPSDLLRRRPDIRQAERQVAAATARIGVATADLFPRFSLTGSLGLQSANLSDLIASGSTFWSIGPAMQWPIFNAGRIRANIQVQDAREEQFLIRYEQTVLASLQEVENALTAHYNEQETRGSLIKAVEANRRAYEISNELYTRGLIDFLTVLDSQRSMYLSEDQLAQSDARVSANLVALFKALGGGWEVTP